MKYLKEFSVFDELSDSGFRERPQSITDISVGDRVRVYKMPEDPDPIEDGVEGTVLYTDKFSQTIYVEWDSGRTLNLLFDVDDFVWLPKD